MNLTENLMPLGEPVRTVEGQALCRTCGSRNTTLRVFEPVEVEPGEFDEVVLIDCHDCRCQTP
ncbi:hypothetical protein DMP23_47420 [Amycolatopsis sp. A1MSW2902]|uniref:hypothetical protein n=1 Tax=Amycolatopsis sp. A1MSW2902 TaxID=687413 RepID=UPI00307DF2E3